MTNEYIESLDIFNYDNFCGDLEIEWQDTQKSQIILYLRGWKGGKDPFLTVAWDAELDVVACIQEAESFADWLTAQTENVGIGARYECSFPDEAILKPLKGSGESVSLPRNYRAIMPRADGEDAEKNYLQNQDDETHFPETISVFSTSGDFHLSPSYKDGRCKKSKQVFINIPFDDESSLNAIENLLYSVHPMKAEPGVLAAIMQEIKHVAQTGQDNDPELDQPMPTAG